jgi:hypothetical protein
VRSSTVEGPRRRPLWVVSGIVVGTLLLGAVVQSQSVVGGAATGVPKRGVVTITMALVGDPGNPSVGVIQTFGLTGTKGQAVTPPENTGSTGIYKSCADVPSSSKKRCLTVGNVNYNYGIGEFDVTVSQYVTFLNTADPFGRNARQLYFDDMSPAVWPKYGSISYASSAPPASTTPSPIRSGRTSRSTSPISAGRPDS